jgi:hypothetical protein
VGRGYFIDVKTRVATLSPSPACGRGLGRGKRAWQVFSSIFHARWQSLWLLAFQLYLNAAQLKIPFALSLSKGSGCWPVIQHARRERLSEEHCVLSVSTTPTQQGDILWEPATLISAPAT